MSGPLGLWGWAATLDILLMMYPVPRRHLPALDDGRVLPHSHQVSQVWHPVECLLTTDVPYQHRRATLQGS